MKNTLILHSTIALAIATAVTAPFAAANPPKSSPNPPTGAVAAVPAKTATFAVTKMHCEGCAAGLTQAAGKWPGVKSADVSFAQKRALVTYNPRLTSPAKISKEFARVGFPAKLVR